MLLTRLEPDEAMATWPSIEMALKSALTDRPAADVREAVRTSDMAVFLAHAMAGFGVVIVRVADTLETKAKALFIHYLAGRCPLGRATATMREAVAHLETAARSIGCVEMRLGGRVGFLRTFPDYELISRTDGHVEMKKVL